MRERQRGKREKSRNEIGKERKNLTSKKERKKGRKCFMKKMRVLSDHPRKTAIEEQPSEEKKKTK